MESQAEQVCLAFDRGPLVLTQVTREALPANSGRPIWMWDERIGAWRCEAIHYATVRGALTSRYGRRLVDRVAAPASVRWARVDLPRFRPEQRHALAAWMDAGLRGQIIMPTGTGKTEVALAAMAQTGVATLVVAPVRDLMYQ